MINDVPLAESPTSMGSLFQAAGYDTGYIGKWHVHGHGRMAFVPPAHRQGFEYWSANECSHDYWNSGYYHADSPQMQTWPGYDAAAQTDEALKFLRHRDRTNPFFLVLSWGPPHDPYDTAPEKFRQQMAETELTLRPNVPLELAEEATRDLKGYYAHVLALDELFGRLLNEITAMGLEEETLIVFWSDHGDMLYSQGNTHKQKPWDESIRVPLLLRWPGHIRPEARLEMINTPDILPTLLGLCGLPSPESIDGDDYSPNLTGGKGPLGESALLASYHPFGEYAETLGGREYRGIRTPNTTYVRDLHGPWLLYDNVSDPYQLSNLCNMPDSSSLQEEMERLLAQSLVATDDRFMPGSYYLEHFGYSVDETGTAPVYNFPGTP
jgi:arylsulfatase A-like enzyme